MPKEADQSAKALKELVRLLEEAVQAGADGLELEWEGQDLVVYQYAGHTGVGAAAIAESLQEAVMQEIVHRAKLTNKLSGTMLLKLLGNDYEIFVKQYDSFGECAFSLRLNKARKKTAR